MAKQDPMIEKAVNRLKLASMDPQVREQYEAREKAIKDIASIRHDSFEDGKLEGKLEGKRNMARNLLKEGVEIPIILRASGLTKEEVEELDVELD